MLTHLAALFFIAGQGLIWAWLLWRQTRYGRWLVIGAVAIGLGMVPLLPLLVPRLFTPNESGFVLVSLPTILNDAIGGYSMGVTAPDVPWLRTMLWWGYLLLIGFSFYRLVQNRRWPAVWLLGLSLLAPALVVWGVSHIKAMYQGVRHIMLGSGAFWVLLALAAQEKDKGERVKDKRRFSEGIGLRLGAAGTVFLALGVPLVGSVGSLWSLWNNQQVAKDDLRGMVHYIEGTESSQWYNSAM